MTSSVDRLRNHVYRLADDVGERNVFCPDALHAAEDYIRKTWRLLGYEVIDQPYEAQGVRSVNLETNRTGVAFPDQVILLGAHYDSVVGSPGGNDNGSGVAALLEISRRFVATDPLRTVRFVAFVNEEPPFFNSKQQGSLV